MCKDNVKNMINKIISDFDAVSLYPSAQKRLYYPIGVCHTMTAEEISYYNKHLNLFNITESRDSID